MTRTPARLLLSGYYGFGNFGDEAILRVFVDQWRERRPGDSIVVLSADPRETASTYGVRSVERMDAHVVGQAIRDADLVVSGGGGLLQSSTSLRSLLYYTGIIREAKRAGRSSIGRAAPSGDRGMRPSTSSFAHFHRSQAKGKRRCSAGPSEWTSCMRH